MDRRLRHRRLRHAERACGAARDTGRAHRLDRDCERPLEDGRRRPGRARAHRGRPARARDPRRRLVPAGPRQPRTRPPPRTRAPLVPHAAGRRVRRDRVRRGVAPEQEREAAHGARARSPHAPQGGGRIHAGRCDHVSAAGLRAASHLVAGLPVGADRRAGRRLRADALHRRRLQGLRRDLRLRCPIAQAPARGRRPGHRRSRGGWRREPDDGATSFAPSTTPCSTTARRRAGASTTSRRRLPPAGPRWRASRPRSADAR